MENIDIEAFKKAGFTYDEIQDLIESEKEFEETGVPYNFEDIKKLARSELFSKQEINV